jgi:hypothetical protein
MIVGRALTGQRDIGSGFAGVEESVPELEDACGGRLRRQAVAG